MGEEITGWVSWGPGGPGEDVPPEVREELLRSRDERRERRGRLLARVEVEVYETGECLAQVSAPPDSTLDLSDTETIAGVVQAARDELGRWR